MAKFMIYDEEKEEEQLFLRLRRYDTGNGVSLEIVDALGRLKNVVLVIGDLTMARISNIPKKYADAIGFAIDENGRIKEAY